MSFSPSSVAKCVSTVLLTAVLGCGSDDGASEYVQGMAAYGARDLKKAERLIEKSSDCDPNDVDRLVALARVKLDLGDLKAAKAAVVRASSLRGDDEDVILLGAQVAWHLKDYALAASGFQRVAENANLDAGVRAQGFAGLGVVEMTRDNHHLARVAFLKAIRLDRKNAAAWYHLAMLYRDGFGYQQIALEHFEIFVRLEVSASPRVQKVQRSTIPAVKEAVARTMANLPGASKRDSAACSTALAKAEAAWKKAAFKQARQSYQDALSADALSYPAALGLAKAWAKTDATKAGQVKALECYRRACELRPSAISTYLTAGSLAAKLGFNAQASEIYSRAVAASPTSLEALDGLIRALRKAGNSTTAANAYQSYRASLSVKKR